MINAEIKAGEPEARCDYCHRALPSGLWFARIRRSGRLLTFCRPRCLEMFLDAASPDDANWESRGPTVDGWQPMGDEALCH